jgi:hypothetical protein
LIEHSVNRENEGWDDDRISLVGMGLCEDEHCDCHGWGAFELAEEPSIIGYKINGCLHCKYIIIKKQ